MFRRFYLVAFILFLLTANSCSKETAEPSLVVAKAVSSPEIEQQLMNLVNAHRIALGYSTLEFSPVAYAFASAHTDYMIAEGKLSHDNFTARASSISAEVDAEYVAENVAKDYPGAQEAFDGWMKSIDHRTAIEGDFTHTAVSVKKDTGGHFYYTELFYRQSPESQ